MTVVIGQAKTDARDRVWKVIRGLTAFTYDDVTTLTGIPEYSVSVYLRKLYHAGYVRRAGRQAGANGKLKAVWWLVRNTGPKAPVPCQCLYDPNIDDAAVIASDDKGRTEAGHVD
jgi:hypothetical protein